MFVLRDFISGAIPVNLDTNTIYGVAKYYFNNLLNGVVPLWDPFVGLGRPFYALPICNLFNPVTQLMPLLKLAGLNYNAAFIAYIVVYFFVGCMGFYFLAREILKDRFLAYLAYIAFMFSSLGVSMFTQLTFIEILVPVIWFFYFLMAFVRAPTAGHCMGMAVAVMISLSAYLPFYFLTLLTVCAVLYSIIYTREAGQVLVIMGKFIRARFWIFALCVAGIVCAAAPLAAYKALDVSGETVSPGRHCQYSSAQECYDRTMHHKGGMLYEEIARSGGLGERFDVSYLFSHLDKITYGSDSFFFLPVWIYIILAMSIFLPLKRGTVFLAGTALIIGLIALGQSSFIHKFLYDHVFFFKYFRNLFFFAAFILPIVILLSLLQLQALLAHKPKGLTRKKIAITGAVLAHVAFFLYVRSFSGVMGAVWVTAACSALLFGLFYVNAFRRKMAVWVWLFAALMVIQPIMIMNAYALRAVEFKCTLPSAHVIPAFGWIRPDTPATSPCRIYQFVPYEDFWYAMSMTDAPAKVGYPQAAARWAFDVSQTIDTNELAAYAKYKVYVYDGLNMPGQAMAGPTENLDVAHFDVNRVVFKTNFPKRKFLVYNDAFMNVWQVKVDGRREILLRANGAFKGVWVPEGEHQVEFRYQPPGGQWIYVAVTGLLALFALATAILLIVEARPRRSRGQGKHHD